MLAGNAVTILIFSPGHVHGFLCIVGDDAPHRLNGSADIKIAMKPGAPKAHWWYTPTVDFVLFRGGMGAHNHDAIKHCLGQTCLLIFLSLGYILIRPNMELGPIFQIALITLRYTIDCHRAIDVIPERHRVRHHHFL